MGDPLSATAAAGMGIGLAGSLLKGNAEQQQLQQRAAASQENQQLAEQQAADALQRGALAAGLQRTKGSQVIGAQRAGFAASGIDENSGSAAGVQAAARGMSELDAQTTLNNARRQAWGYQVTAQQYGEQAKLDQQGVSETGIGSDLAAGGQLLGGLGRVLQHDRPDLTGGM